MCNVMPRDPITELEHAERDLRAGRRVRLPRGTWDWAERRASFRQLKGLKRAAEQLERAAGARMAEMRRKGVSSRDPRYRRVYRVKEHAEMVKHQARSEIKRREAAFPDPRDVRATEEVVREKVIAGATLSRATVRALRGLADDRHEWGGGINIPRHNVEGKYSVPEKITARRGRFGSTRSDPEHHAAFHTHPRRSDREMHYGLAGRVLGNLKHLRAPWARARAEALARDIVELHNRARLSSTRAGGGDVMVLGLRYQQTHVLAAGKRFVIYNPIRGALAPQEYDALVKAARREAAARSGIERARTLRGAEEAFRVYERVYAERLRQGAKGKGALLTVTKRRPHIILTWFNAHKAAQSWEPREGDFYVKKKGKALSAPRGRGARTGSRRASRRAGSGSRSAGRRTGSRTGPRGARRGGSGSGGSGRKR